jgi:hypothetical protein
VSGFQNISAPHSQRLERWLGAATIERLQRDMRGWYAGPIPIADIPGNIAITADGDFVGQLGGSKFCQAQDALEHLRTHRLRLLRKHLLRRGLAKKQSGMAGFTSLSDLVSEATVAGKLQPLGGNLNKVGSAGVIGATNSLFRVGNSPAAGTAAAAAPLGTAPTSATLGALAFANPPATDLQYLMSADVLCTVASNSLLVYDRTYSVAVNPNSIVTQPVTGLPTRYQNAAAGVADSAVGNFAFFEVGAALAATAHSITLAYKDQTNSASESAPLLAGVAGAGANRLDHAGWFAPLNGADSGVTSVTSATLSAAVATGAMDLVIGHPLAWLAFPIANVITPFDWVNVKFGPGRIFDNACLALLEVGKGNAAAATYTGTLLGAWG